MAFVYCEKCGQKFSDEFPRCPYCGHVRGSGSYGQCGKDDAGEIRKNCSGQNYYENGCHNQNNPYGQNPYGEYRYGNTPDGQNYYGNNYNPYGTYYKRRQINVGQLVFSIINIITGIGLIFGVIALIMTCFAVDAKDDNEEFSKLRTAKILNIIGISLLGLVFLMYFGLLFFAFFMIGLGY